MTVTPLNPLKRGVFRDDLLQLKRLCAERRVEALVVGLPLDDLGNPTVQAQHCQRYGVRLARALSLPMALVNEHSGGAICFRKIFREPLELFRIGESS